MWRHISDRLKEYPGRQKVARVLVESGLAIREGNKIYCGGIELSDVKIARYLDVDRRTVRDTAQLITSDPELKSVFERLKPAGPFLADIAKFLGYSVIEIYRGSSHSRHRGAGRGFSCPREHRHKTSSRRRPRPHA